MEGNWEIFTIKIDTIGEGNETERGEVTDRFETELFRLIQKYQGQAGLEFEARNSDNRQIVEYY